MPSPDPDREAGEADDIATGSAAETSDRWSPERQKVAQMVWGEGFTGPGGADRVLTIVGRLALDETATLIEFGSGLGGGARAIATKLGAYVTGWELDAALAKEATIQARVHSLEKQVTVKHLDPDRLELKPEGFNGALIRDMLYRIEDKESFLETIARSMKFDTEILIDDLFFGENEPGKEVDEWMAREDITIYPWTVESARAALEKLDLEIRVTTDETAAYCASAVEAWGAFADRMDKSPPPADLAVATMREVECWTSRLAALDAHQLCLYRIVAHRKNLIA